jgi:hypothetical protein
MEAAYASVLGGNMPHDDRGCWFLVIICIVAAIAEIIKQMRE